ncbi:MAG: PBSX family phage terminase large subunit [Candidatus Gastranaerophilaceae bacterium]|nr:PBSX family phage terminase large subunit [Candidatus Gastranaerophilaceae bacterium]
MPIKWEKSKYSLKARQFLSKPPEEFPLLTLLDGAVRSGKTLNIIQKIPQIFDSIGNDNLKVFSGYSKSTVRNNVLIELKPFIENYLGGNLKYNSASGEMEITLWGKVYPCLVVGGGDSDSVASIQGGTWDFWYANELPQHHYNFYNMALSRLTPANAKAFADSNPESSNHWLYQEKIKPYIEGDKTVRDVFEYWHFTMKDNANLSQTFINNQEKLYQGAFKARKIDGLWIVADGLVYDTFCRSKHVLPHSQMLDKILKNDILEYFLGVDWGWNHPTACLLLGIDKDGTYYIIDELYSTKIEAEDVINWINEKQKEYGRFFSFANCDNARPEQNDKLRKNTNLIIYEEKPKVEDSISLVRGLINYDNIIVSDVCKATLGEFETYRYPSETDKLKGGISLDGSDTPLKVNDDCMDAMRYAIYKHLTTFRRK